LAAARLKSTDHRQFAYSLLGFLQTVSPFVIASAEESCFADVLTALFNDQLSPRERMLSPKELVLLVQMHEDVLSTPPDQLVQAIDYVKSSILRGQPYSVAEYAEVSLGLKSFLASSADERRKELESERARAAFAAEQEKATAEEERRQRIEAHEQLRRQSLELEDLRERDQEKAHRIEALTGELSSTKSAVEELGQLRKLIEHRDSIRRLVWMLVGIALGALMWRKVGSITALLEGSFATSLSSHMPAFVKTVAWIVFVLPSVLFVRGTQWADQGKVGFAAAVLLSGYWLSGGAANTPVVSAAACAGLIAAALVLGFKSSLLGSSVK
jgi:hypothetical protein